MARLGTVRLYHASAVRQSQNQTSLMDVMEAPEPVMRQGEDESLSVLEARHATIDRINRAILKKYGGKYSVRAFGSTEYGVSGEKSDLDLVIIVRRSLLNCG